METAYAMAEQSQEGYRQKPQRAKKQLGFFKSWLLKSVKEAVDLERQQEANVVREQDIVSTKSLRIGRNEASIDQPERAIQFTIYTANGGRVVETRRYDKKTDRNTNGLYVITNDQDFGKEIDKIITMESLRS